MAQPGRTRDTESLIRPPRRPRPRTPETSELVIPDTTADVPTPGRTPRTPRPDGGRRPGVPGTSVVPNPPESSRPRPNVPSAPRPRRPRPSTTPSGGGTTGTAATAPRVGRFRRAVAKGLRAGAKGVRNRRARRAAKGKG